MTKTLADMTADERADCVGMWCDVIGFTRPTPIVYIWGEEVELLIYNNLRGHVTETYDFSSVTPRFDLPRLALDVRIIRTLEELEKLDPDTVLIESDGEEVLAYRMQKSIRSLGNESMYYDSLPATVIATGAQVRAAREAMEIDNG